MAANVTAPDIIINYILKDIPLKESSVRNTVRLLNEGSTVPFIARYRKEMTGNLNEIQIREISERLEYYTELEQRKDTVIKTIREQNKMTPELEQQIRACVDRLKLEDIYLPYKPKKRTRATIAREKGLEPLAEYIMLQRDTAQSREAVARSYVDPERGVSTIDEAISGACDIVAESIAENAEIRSYLREYMHDHGRILSKAKKDWADKKTKFENYYRFSEPIRNSPAHRILAIRRGTDEEILTWSIEVDEHEAQDFIGRSVIKNPSFLLYDELVRTVQDSWARLLYSSLQSEVFTLKVKQAEEEAITIFAKNVHTVLLSPPAGNKPVLGVDPAYRTGCKCAVVDGYGTMKEYATVYPLEEEKKAAAIEIVLRMVSQYHIDLIAIGNGTASKETRSFIQSILKQNQVSARVVMISEAGASVYSASSVAQREFPDLDVTIRGAISIARRLQDPLAELVKVDPKSIGVGQYQHDVDQSKLKRSLDMTVESCVNYVGVELNTASAELLSYVSGIGSILAKNIVEYRTRQGGFRTRQELHEVKNLKDKAFEQCAGFLRIRQSKNPLDNSAIHPESYPIVERMASDNGISITDLIGNEDLVRKISVSRYVTDTVGLPTLQDIVEELKKPGRDPREAFDSVQFSLSINTIDDVSIGMILQGVVTNVTRFGAFVDIGVHLDGLIHISKMSDSFVRDPQDLLKVGDTVQVKVIAVDKELKRIGLSLVATKE